MLQLTRSQRRACLVTLCLLATNIPLCDAPTASATPPTGRTNVIVPSNEASYAVGQGYATANMTSVTTDNGCTPSSCTSAQLANGGVICSDTCVDIAHTSGKEYDTNNSTYTLYYDQQAPSLGSSCSFNATGPNGRPLANVQYFLNNSPTVGEVWLNASGMPGLGDYGHFCLGVYGKRHNDSVFQPLLIQVGANCCGTTATFAIFSPVQIDEVALSIGWSYPSPQSGSGWMGWNVYDLEVLTGIGPPTQPQGNNATATSGNTILQTWNDPASTGGSAVTSFNVYRGSNSAMTCDGTTYIASMSGSAHSFNHTGLAGGTTYYVRVSAVTSGGEGACAPPASATTLQTATQPQSNAAVANGTTINQSWAYPASDGGSVITTYRVYRGSNSAMTCDNTTFVGTTTEPTRFFLHTSLAGSTTYYVRVSAVSAAGEGTCAPPASATTGASTTQTSSATPPTQPQGNALTATSGTTLHESWTDPASNGGANVTSFRLYLGSNSAMTCDGTTFAASVDGSTHAFDYTGLSPGTTYYARVSAVNSAGEGACAPPASATTFSVPTQPQANAATASSTTTIQQTWSYPASDGGSPVATYRVYRGLNSAMTCDNSSLVGVTSEPTRTFNHTGLSPGGTYYVRVSAVNSVGEGACAPPASATTGSAPAGASPPTQPQGNAASATSGTTIHETWTDPASNGGATVTAFNVYRGATSAMVCDGTTFIASVTASTHAYEHAGLSPGSTYYVRVSAVNAAGEGACAPPASATTFSAPTQPQANNAVAVSASAVNQSWSYPASDGGSPVASYRVFRGTSTAMTCDNTTFVATVTEPTRYYLHTGLAASTTIYVRVSAVNGVGEGACAPPASATTQSSVGTATPPSQPQSNAATANGTTIQQAWTAPANSGGATITAYNVYRGTSSAMPCDGTTFVASVSGTTFAYSHVGLASQVTYYVRVSAVNSAGEGTCAPPASATTASPPTQPLNLTANVTGANLTLAWSAPASDGGSQLQGYDLYVGFDATMSCDASTRVASSVALTNRTWTFANLPNGSYFARASAVNGVGEGACSATTTATITSGGIEATSLGGASGSSGGGSVWALLGAVFALVLAVAGIETILRLAAWIRGP